MLNAPRLHYLLRKSSTVNPKSIPSLSRSLSAICDDPPFSPIPKIPPKSHQPSQLRKKKKKKQQQKGGKAPKPSAADEGPFKSDHPFDFRYSYSEINPAVNPIGFREPPRFSPFGPGRLDRKWTGVSAPATAEIDVEQWTELTNQVLGDPLSEEEFADLVERYRHRDCNRQINIGEGGVTHNLLYDIHNHWKRAEAMRIKCLGVRTLDMDNLCFHLEDKSRVKVIYQNINILLLYRGRNYDPKNRPVIALMLWKPYAPIYPKLVKHVAEGLTFEETKELRSRGLDSPPYETYKKWRVYQCG